MMVLNLLFATLLLTPGATDVLASLPPEVRESIRETKVLIITEKNRDTIWQLRPGGQIDRPDYIVMDVGFSKLTSAMVQVLVDYVKRGGGLLVTSFNATSQIIPNFSSQQRNVAYATGIFTPVGSEHPVLTSVKTVRIHPYVLWDSESGGTPLLQNGEDTFASVAFEVGTGRMICFAVPVPFIPLPQNKNTLDTHDNTRFAINIDQWLAGFPVPGYATSGSGSLTVARVSLDRIILKNGDNLSGDLLASTITIKTSYAVLNFTLSEISRITIEGSGANSDSIILVNGDRLSGMIQNAELKIRLSSGAEATLDRDKIKEVHLKSRNAAKPNR